MKHEDITGLIIKSYYDTYNNLGYGFCEEAYENAFMIELDKNGLSAQNQHPIEVNYKNYKIGDWYSDILVENKIILELKAVEKLIEKHEAQLLRYLTVTDKEVGLLFNFGKKAEFKRKIFSNENKQYLNPKENPNPGYNSDNNFESIIGCFYDCYNVLGYGFKDYIYKRALMLEFADNSIQVNPDEHLDIYYDDQIVSQFTPDFMIDGKMLVITNNSCLTDIEKKLLFNLLKSTRTKSGILLNFGEEPEFEKCLREE